MLGSCNYTVYNDNRCNSTYQLTTLLFRDPYSPSNIQQIELCRSHYDELCRNLQERIKNNTMKIANLIAQKARERKLSRDNDHYYNDSSIQQKIEDHIENQKYMQSRECRNFLCMKDLTTLSQTEKIYSVHTFKSNGKRQYSFYFCSIKCFNFMKGMCGIKNLINKGQTLLVSG